MLGEPAGRTGVGDAVDVVEREAGVGQGLVDHRHLEGAAVAVELAGRGDGIGHPHEGGGAAQGAGAHEAAEAARSCATAS